MSRECPEDQHLSLTVKFIDEQAHTLRNAIVAANVPLAFLGFCVRCCLTLLWLEECAK
jgi:hypothetical protein